VSRLEVKEESMYDDAVYKHGREARPWWRRKRIILPLTAAIIVIALGVGIGLGVGLKKDDAEEPSPSSTPSSTPTPTVDPNRQLWTPAKGTTWQIVLNKALSDDTLNSLATTWKDTEVFDIDLYTNPKSTIDKLHENGKKVVCYFSAGSYEPYRPDSSEFQQSDLGLTLDGWPDEKWLNTSSPAIRSIMLKRLDTALGKGCDAVDPDNTDGFDNVNGLGLTEASAIDYMRFLAKAAHERKMAIGLKNSGAIIAEVLPDMQFSVNEQCVQYNECETFRPFVDDNKPVFGIEYPKETNTEVTTAVVTKICGNKEVEGFSTLLKNMDLDEWVEVCPASS
jgi:hypothetical protein